MSTSQQDLSYQTFLFIKNGEFLKVDAIKVKFIASCLYEYKDFPSLGLRDSEIRTGHFETSFQFVADSTYPEKSGLNQAISKLKESSKQIMGMKFDSLEVKFLMTLSELRSFDSDKSSQDYFIKIPDSENAMKVQWQYFQQRFNDTGLIINSFYINKTEAILKGGFNEVTLILIPIFER